MGEAKRKAMDAEMAVMRLKVEEESKAQWAEIKRKKAEEEAEQARLQALETSREVKAALPKILAAWPEGTVKHTPDSHVKAVKEPKQEEEFWEATEEDGVDATKEDEEKKKKPL